MARAYPFLDIAVLDEVRERFAAGDALVILRADLTRILWANGSGSAMLGYPGIEDAINNEPQLSPVARRQMTGLAGFPDIGTNRTLALRLNSGLNSHLVVFQASTITMPGGEKAILLSSSINTDITDAARADHIIAGIDGPGQFAALLDTEGNIVTASQGFATLDISQQSLKGLVAEVRTESDRLVKRLISDDRALPAGIARLTDDPALHLLLIVDDGREPNSPALHEAAPEPISPAPHFEPSTITDSEASVARTVRFAWRTDADGNFTSLSKELGEAVGKPASDVIGRTFRDVSNAFGLDTDGTIHRLMERRDTWSGRTVMWPLAGTALKVPVDLAALPVYGRGKVFEGFRGFGIARMSETVVDPEGIGTVLLTPTPSAEVQAVEASPGEPETKLDIPDPFEGELPALEISKDHTRRASDKNLDWAADDKAPGLSPVERLAFREIGERLRRANEALAARSNRDDVFEEEDQADTPLDPLPLFSEQQPNADEEILPEPTAEAIPPSESQAETINEKPATITPDLEQDRIKKSEQRFRQVRSLLSLIPSEPLPTLQQTAEPAAATTPIDLEHFITNLPLPVLIHSGDNLHFANPEFLLLTGYADLASLADAGGIGALFDEPLSRQTLDDTALSLRTANGSHAPVQARLQSVKWEGRKMLMLALRPVARTIAPRLESFETATTGLDLAEMQAIVDTAADGVIIITREGEISSLNAPAEALFGFSIENVVGKPFSNLFAIESQRVVQDYIAAMAQSSLKSVLHDGRHVIGREAHGRFIPLFITLARLPGDRGFCALLRDISHWKRVEDELTQARAQAERASSHKSEFLARVSHEIRTPLNAIIGFSELMIDEKFGTISNERYRDYLRDINRSGNHVLDLVNDLLDISKIEAGEQEMHYEAVSLNEALEQAVAMMQPQANSERVIIRSSLASDIPDVVADARSVRQIALNLLSNAVRYTPAGGQIIVSTAHQMDGSIVLRVRDTGIGMSALEIEEALKPFRQINTLRRNRGDGTGLGLPLTRAMVEANRAFFSINSAPGDGTLVEITFPPSRVLAD